MLVHPAETKYIMEYHGIDIRGILHVGAHLCEEKQDYNVTWNVKDEDIIWVDANPKCVATILEKGIPHAYTAVLDETERDTEFHIANNGQSSSLLEFGTHQNSYPEITYTETLKVHTMTLSTFFKTFSLNPRHYNIWIFDIQGSELAALRGAGVLLYGVDLICCEVSTEEVYKGCATLAEIDEYLLKYGLIRVSIKMTEDGWGDAIYVRMKE